jgi:hypothetical protein
MIHFSSVAHALTLTFAVSVILCTIHTDIEVASDIDNAYKAVFGTNLYDTSVTDSVL